MTDAEQVPMPEAFFALGEQFTLPAGADGSDGPRVIRFIERYCRQTRGRGAGELLRLKHFQRQIVIDIFATIGGRRMYRRGLLGLPRKNGKSALGAGIALYMLLADGEAGAEVYSCAGDRDQAKIVFLEACTMLEMDRDYGDGFLWNRARIQKSSNIIFAIDPDTGRTVGLYKALSAEAYTKEGLNPSCVIFDEVHVQPDDGLWNVMTLGSATRERPLIIGITTAGWNKRSLCGRLYDLGKRGARGFYFRWWEAPDLACDHTDEDVWRLCNPGLTGSPDLLPGEVGFLNLDAIRDELYGSEATSENAFRRYRLNQWTNSAEAWLPAGAWDACTGAEPLAEGARIAVAFDGSHANDTAALVACTVDGDLYVLGAWERPAGPLGDGWRVPRADVLDRVREVCRAYNVRLLAYDPFRWTMEMQTLEAEGVPVEEFPQTPARMNPAAEAFYRAVLDRRVHHDGSEPLARHMSNVHVVDTRQGPKLQKEHANSERKIDLAIAAVMAYARSTHMDDDDGYSYPHVY